MTEKNTSEGSSGRYIVAVLLAISSVILGAAAAIMDPSPTRILMTVSALVLLALTGALLGVALSASPYRYHQQSCVTRWPVSVTDSPALRDVRCSR